MTRRTKLLAALGAAAAVAAGGVGIAQAVSGGDSDDVQATGPAADRAKAAGLKAAGGGRVVSVEREQEAGSAWEVEVVRPDGTEVEVGLDSAYRSTGVDREDRDDQEGANDDEGPDEDEGAGDD